MKYSVWVGGVEVNDYLLNKKEAISLKEYFIDEGYSDVKMEVLKNIRKFA